MNSQIRNWLPHDIHYVEEIDSELTYHLYCYYKETIREIYKETLEGKRYVRAGVWDRTGCMGGPHPLKTFTQPKSDLRWYEYMPTYKPNVRIDRIFINKKQIIKIVPQLQYVLPLRYDDALDIYDFIKTLKQFPQLEMIYKNDYLREYWRCKAIYKLNKKELYALARFIECDPREKFADGQLNQLIYLVKHPEIKSSEQYENIKYYQLAKKVKGFMGEYKDLAQYLKKLVKNNVYGSKTEAVREYIDYNKLCVKLGIFEAYYPKNIKERISNLSKQVEKKENSKPLLSKKKLNEYKKKLIADKTLTMSIPNTQNEFIKIGNKLEFCLGSCGYNDKQKKGESLIVLFSDKKRKPQECAEITLKDMKLNQLYGKGDTTDGKYHKLAKKLINRYIREIKDGINKR